MDLWVWIAIVAAGIVAVTVPAIRTRLRNRGPGLPGPIDAAIADTPVPEADDAAVPEDVHIRALGPIARARYRVQWSDVQRRFRHVPRAAVVDADELITEVMHECGYPVEEFDTRTDVSLEHPDVVHNYRTAHRICIKTVDGNGTREELQTAVRSYHALFEELVGTAR
jgi:hypothetical protein